MLIGCTTALTLVGETQTPLDSEEVEFVGEAPGVSFTISPPGGTFTDSMEVSLDFEGAEPDIYYTLDGSKPDDRDEHYEGPILLDSSAQVRAIATNRHGDPIGGALSQSYVRLDSELEDFSSNLPLLVLSSDESVPGSRADHTPFAHCPHTFSKLHQLSLEVSPFNPLECCPAVCPHDFSEPRT